ncbi:MAG: FadR/GntR family transcriptional regulator [Oscillospiraceae bacterium]|nr:FadR/GntR family transcriptional regulator [Oscillospiraceae bacterium]
METKNQMTKCDYVMEQLKDKIISGVYKSGDQLPPEGALCEMFDVSRITVREALKKLSMMGLLDIKQGRGTFVKAIDLGLFMKPLYQLIDFEEIDVNAIYNAREYIEGGAAHLAALSRTDRELAILGSVLQNLKGAIAEGDMLRIMQYDDEFHVQVARAAHNPILLACLEAIAEINKACLKRFSKYFTMLEDCYAEHFAIFDAIAKMDAERAEEAIVAHARSSKAVLLK